MNDFYMSVLIIFSISLVIWVVLSNELYLKVSFSNLRYGEINNSISGYGKEKDISFYLDKNYTIPDYIKKVVLKNSDNFKLLSYYLMSKNLIDYKVFVDGLASSDSRKNKVFIFYFDFCEISFFNFFEYKNYFIFNFFLKTIRFLSLLLIAYLFLIFIDDLAGSTKVYAKDYRIIVQYYFVAIFVFLVLMPYEVMFKITFLNKLFSTLVFWFSVFFAIFNSYYIFNFEGDFLFDKTIFVLIFSIFTILLGAYSYVGYAKFEFFTKFFQLLEFENQLRNKSKIIDEKSNIASASDKEKFEVKVDT